MGKKIDAEELYHRMYEEAFEKDSDLQRWDSGCWIRFKLFENVLKDMPEIEVEEKTGHWIEKNANKDGTHNIYCSNCNNYLKFKGHANSYNARTKLKYCPNCGAKMEGKK